MSDTNEDDKAFLKLFVKELPKSLPARDCFGIRYFHTSTIPKNHDIIVENRYILHEDGTTEILKEK